MWSWLRGFLGVVIFVGWSGPGRAATELSTMQPAEIEVLQKRLTDDGCYAGPIDGQASAVTLQAVKACPDQNPVLRIETGMHGAEINRIGVDGACHVVATGSRDKTVRLWSLPEGRLLRVIRLPIGPGNSGDLYAVALSPDGRTLAAGGYDSDLYLVDLASDRVSRYRGLGNGIADLAFSADGSRVAVALLSGLGVRVVEVATGRELMSDRDYADHSESVAFGADGSLYATGIDGFVRRYRPNLTRAAKIKLPNGRRLYEVAVDPTGHRIAVGAYDSVDISILDAATLRVIGQAETQDAAVGNFASLAWTVDGRQFLAGSLARETFNGQEKIIARRFDSNGKHLGDDVPVSNNVITDMKTCGTVIAFAAADPSIGLIGASGPARTLQASVTADMRLKLGEAFAVSADGDKVRFGTEGETGLVFFSLSDGTLTDAPAMPAGLAIPNIDALPITDWEDTVQPKLNGAPIALQPYEISRSLAIQPDRSSFVLGTNFWLHEFGIDGKEHWKTAVPGEVWGVNATAGGKVMLAAYSDGTIRWHRSSDGLELLALFLKPQTKAWVAWTPSGYYMASPGAEDLIGWHVNRGWNQEADFFPASRFRDKFNRPDIVRLILGTLDEAEAERQANALSKRHNDPTPLIEHLPPVITILSPTEGSTAAPGVVQVRYRTRMPSGGNVDRVEAFVDGAKIEARGLGPSNSAPVPAQGISLALPMPAHDAVISLVAYAGGQASDPARIQLRGASAVGPASTDDALKPSLYALVIGVTHYNNSAYDLGYPAQDAKGVADALEGQTGKLYKHVEVKLLTDKTATALAVKDGLLWLQTQTTARDLAIVFAAGHGMTDAKGRFWFLTADANPDRLLTTAVSKDDIADVLYDLPGKKLLFLDACHSGAALSAGTRSVEQTDLSAAINDFAQTEGGVVAYAASTGKEFSFENEQWGHGAFTKALIEGLGGKADLLHKGTITTATLDLFLEDRVKELTGGRQHPVMNRPKTVPDFPIAAVQ